VRDLGQGCALTAATEADSKDCKANQNARHASLLANLRPNRLFTRQLTGEDKDQQVTLDHLANASVQGLVATGPRRGCRVLRLGGTGEDAEAAIIGKRCADVAGFNVHANVRVGANDRDGLEHLCSNGPREWHSHPG
jgi:hypothetical protein